MEEKPKLSGMEMMLNSLMKAAGFNPVEIQKQMGIVINGFQNGLNELGNSLKAIHAEQQRARMIQEKISRDNEIIKAALGIHDAQALISSDAHPTRQEDNPHE